MRALIPLLALLIIASDLRADDKAALDPSFEIRAVLGSYASGTGAIAIRPAGLGAAFVSGDRWQSVGFYQDSAYSGITRRVGLDNRPNSPLEQGSLNFRLQPDGRLRAKLVWPGSKASVWEVWTRIEKGAPDTSAAKSSSAPPGNMTHSANPPNAYRPTEAPPPRPGPGDPKMGEYVYVEELPEALTKVAPEYPEEARRKGIDGTVMVQALVRKDGTIGDAFIIKSIPALDLAAARAVWQWVFKPARAKGEPVAVWVAIPVKFTLH
jgi:TonB family protein